MSTESLPPSPTDDDNRSSSLKGILKRISPLRRFSNYLGKAEPEDRQDLREVLQTAHARDILDDESYSIIAGTMSFADKTCDDIQISRSKMDLINIDWSIQEIIDFVIDTAHSRFPVYEGERDNIIGLLLAKDLLRIIIQPELDIKQLLRPAHFVPESKRLNQLLKEFKETRSHLALVIDEYGSITGLVTMEDILEEIVGDIEDEYDEESEQTIFPESDVAWRIMALTPIEDFNKIVGAHIPEDEHDTIGGWLASELDHIPKRGDSFNFEDLRFYVLRADEKRAQWIHVRRSPVAVEAAKDDGDK
ncbi:magnesium/cobalt efflux protein [Oligella urethralis]|uniref:HlyC/CorC family transporter n=1 Tax=Oligella urethralis TaxID=90245 RepID=UPI000CFECC87|nr:transporter associated domain-containing protein [Oligella urethralis]AVL70415.1 magnesium/cobalt efflux protein [Oligella urethralis]